MSALSPTARAQITAVILSGGRGRRMQGQDKGLIPLAGRPLVSHVLERLIPQASRVLINANRNLPAYQQFGVTVIRDQHSGFQGPLAGMACALAQCTTPLLLTVPCDSPLLPDDLGSRLYQALEQAQADVAMVHDGTRLQPVFALLRNRLRPALSTYLQTGGRKIEDWIKSQDYCTADCRDIADRFINVNDPEALSRLEAQLQRPDPGPD